MTKNTVWSIWFLCGTNEPPQSLTKAFPDGLGVAFTKNITWDMLHGDVFAFFVSNMNVFPQV